MHKANGHLYHYWPAFALIYGQQNRFTASANNRIENWLFMLLVTCFIDVFVVIDCNYRYYPWFYAAVFTDHWDIQQLTCKLTRNVHNIIICQIIKRVLLLSYNTFSKRTYLFYFSFFNYLYYYIIVNKFYDKKSELSFYRKYNKLLQKTIVCHKTH